MHQTIERLHRQTLKGIPGQSDEIYVQAVFAKTYQQLLRTATHPLSEMEKEQALRQVLNYYQQNQREIQHSRAAEFPVQIDRRAYILRGKVDLLVNGDKGLEVFDFKTHARPDHDSLHLAFYQQQLHLYAHALQKHIGHLPERLWLYWTAEEQKKDALMEVACDKDSMAETVSAVDELVTKMQNKQFEVKIPPSPEICKRCDIRRLCKKEGIL